MLAGWWGLGLEVESWSAGCVFHCLSLHCMCLENYYYY